MNGLLCDVVRPKKEVNLTFSPRAKKPFVPSPTKDEPEDDFETVVHVHEARCKEAPDRLGVRVGRVDHTGVP